MNPEFTRVRTTRRYGYEMENKLKTSFIWILTSIVVLTGCASNSGSGVLTREAACSEWNSKQEFLARFLEEVLTELEGESPSKEKLADMGAEIIDEASSIVEIKVEDEVVEKEILQFAGAMVAFGQTFVDGYDFFTDEEPIKAFEKLTDSTSSTLDVCFF